MGMNSNWLRMLLMCILVSVGEHVGEHGVSLVVTGEIGGVQSVSPSLTSPQSPINTSPWVFDGPPWAPWASVGWTWGPGGGGAEGSRGGAAEPPPALVLAGGPPPPIAPTLPPGSTPTGFSLSGTSPWAPSPRAPCACASPGAPVTSPWVLLATPGWGTLGGGRSSILVFSSFESSSRS